VTGTFTLTLHKKVHQHNSKHERIFHVIDFLVYANKQNGGNSKTYYCPRA
jgi:hypothetical protein